MAAGNTGGASAHSPDSFTTDLWHFMQFFAPSPCQPDSWLYFNVKKYSRKSNKLKKAAFFAIENVCRSLPRREGTRKIPALIWRCMTYLPPTNFYDSDKVVKRQHSIWIFCERSLLIAWPSMVQPFFQTFEFLRQNGERGSQNAYNFKRKFTSFYTVNFCSLFPGISRWFKRLIMHACSVRG